MTQLLPALRRVFIVFSLALGFLAGCGTRTVPPVVVGNVAPRSGPDRDVGLHAEQGIRLAVEEVKAGEPLLPERAVEVRHADSEGKPETAQNVAVRLLSINQATGLIASTDAAAAEQLCRVAQQYKAPVLTPVWLPPAALGPSGFCIGPTAAEQGGALARFAAGRLKPANVTLVVDNRLPGCLARATAFTETLGKDTPVRREEFASSDELTKLAPAVSGAKPGALVFAGKAADLEPFVTKLRAASLPEKTPLLFAGDAESPLALLADRWADQHVLYWTTAFMPDDSAPAQEFIRRYRDRYQQPPDADAALAYDGARLLFEAIRQAKSARPEKVREELAKLKDVPSLTGPVSFEKNQLTPRPVYVVHRVDRQWKWSRSQEPAAPAEKQETKQPGTPAPGK